MLNVALTGNIAAGKSAVVDLFRRWGATVIDADQLVRDAQRPGTEVMQAIAFRFGRDVILPGGELDRTALRGKVMGDDASLADLNAIVHPAVRRERDRLLREARQRGDRIVINDIPLLFEAADPDEFDAVVLVDAPEGLRKERLLKYRGMSSEAADKAIQAQAPSESKRARSDYIIDNTGSLADLESSARQVWTSLLART
jgi:dephospho-CoA kinase